MSELIDLYNRDRQSLCRKVDRSAYLFQPNEFMMYVLAILENEEGKFLVTRRSLNKKWAAGGWEMPGGGAKSGETSEEAIQREVKEETNLDVTILDENKRYSIEYDTNKGTHKEAVYFLAKKTSNNITRQESEITEIKWFNFEEAIETISFENAKELLKKVLTDLKLL